MDNTYTKAMMMSGQAGSEMSDRVQHSRIWATALVITIGLMSGCELLSGIYKPPRTVEQTNAATLNDCARDAERRSSQFCMQLVEKLGGK